MSQDIWAGLINPNTTDGTELAGLLDGFKSAMVSGMKGPSRPTVLEAGGIWVDDSLEASPDFKYTVYLYDGSNDIELFSIDLQTSSAAIAGSQNLFTISKISADTAAPILKFLKERIANNGQVLDGDYIGEIHFYGAASDNTNPVTAKIRAIATDNMTNTASGTCLAFETTEEGTTSLVEHMRLLNGKLGIGTATPDSALHVISTTGIKSQRTSEDANAPIIAVRKKRVTGVGAVLSADKLGEYVFNTTDSSGNEGTTAKLLAEATEAHTPTARGTKLSLYVAKIGQSTLTEQVRIGDTIELFADLTGTGGDFTTLYGGALSCGESDLVQSQVTLDSASYARIASITALSATKLLMNITGTIEATLKGIDSASATQNVIIHNSGTAKITIAHEDAGATAADRIKLPLSKPITVHPDSSVELFYHAGDSRWKVRSAAGSGSGSGGGGSLKWVEDVNAPLKVVEYFQEVYKYQSGLGQSLYASIKVPNGYVAGSPISMKLPLYSPDNTGDVLVQSVATLIRSGVDAVSSTTNQRTSTNAAVSLSAGTVNEPQMVTFDLTDTVGAINSVAVSAGDIIKIELKRGTDTATSDVAVMPLTCEVLFE